MKIDIETLRKNVKYLMVDLGLDQKGSLTFISADTGIPYNGLSMAMTGYRETEAYYQYLEKTLEYLQGIKNQNLHNRNVA